MITRVQAYQVDQTYEEIPGPISTTGDKTAAGPRLVTSIPVTENPAYEAVKSVQAQRGYC